MEGSNADFAPHMKGSNADFAPHMKGISWIRGISVKTQTAKILCDILKVALKNAENLLHATERSKNYKV